MCILNDHDKKKKSYLHVFICSNRLNLSPSPFAAMVNLFSTLAWYCPGWAPVRCHRETGTPMWGSAEVYIFSTVLLFSFLFSVLVLFVFLALSALLGLPIVCAKPTIQRKEELNSLDFQIHFVMLLHVSCLPTSCQRSHVTLKRSSVSVRAR